MKDQDFHTIRNITKSLRIMIDYYRDARGNSPHQLLLNPALYDAWRAELLVTGKLFPWQQFQEFDGVRIRVTRDVTVCELK